MRFEEIKSKVESIEQHSQYMRVSADHPLELYLGKNEKGNPTLRFNGEFTPIKVIGTNLIEIKQVLTIRFFFHSYQQIIPRCSITFVKI